MPICNSVQAAEEGEQANRPTKPTVRMHVCMYGPKLGLIAPKNKFGRANATESWPFTHFFSFSLPSVR